MVVELTIPFLYSGGELSLQVLLFEHEIDQTSWQCLLLYIAPLSHCTKLNQMQCSLKEQQLFPGLENVHQSGYHLNKLSVVQEGLEVNQHHFLLIMFQSV